MSENRDFPLDWDEWARQYNRWARGQGLERVRGKIPGRNLMTDEVMGIYRVGGDIVELSAVTFPNLSERDAATGRLIERTNRYVGITWADRNGPNGISRNGGLVSTWDELEQALKNGVAS